MAGLGIHYGGRGTYQAAAERHTEKRSGGASWEGTPETSRGGGMTERLSGEKKAPYSHLAKNGIIEYEGVVFVCDTQRNRLCLGNVDNLKECICVGLSEGGSLVVNRANLDDLARAINMFSPEDINRILRAIAADRKAREVLLKIEDAKNSIGDAQSSLSTENSQDAEGSLYTSDSRETGWGTAERNHGTAVTDAYEAYAVYRRDGEDEYENIPVATGRNIFTQKEWKRFLERFDLMEAAIRAAQKERLERLEEKRLERERLEEEIQEKQRLKEEEEKKRLKEQEIEGAGLESLTAESIRSGFFTLADGRRARYLTCFTRERIWCSQCTEGEGSRELWRIELTDQMSYEKVLQAAAGLQENQSLQESQGLQGKGDFSVWPGALESFWRAQL